MIQKAFLFDAETGETVSTFGLEVEPTDTDWHPERWGLLRRYTLPAVGPGGHPWMDWAGAVLILGTVAGILGRSLWA